MIVVCLIFLCDFFHVGTVANMGWYGKIAPRRAIVVAKESVNCKQETDTQGSLIRYAAYSNL